MYLDLGKKEWLVWFFLLVGWELGSGVRWLLGLVFLMFLGFGVFIYKMGFIMVFI